MHQHEQATLLCTSFRDRNLNEADVRHQLLDVLFHSVLAWPRANVKCEEHVHPGYIDYVLRDAASRAVLVIESKKEGDYFVVPTKICKDKNAIRKIRLKTLATENSINKAVNQASQYCSPIGCTYACVTNGHEFIIFRSFIPGRHFMDADALVIPSLNFFADNFIEAYNFLSFEAIMGQRSLPIAFGTGNPLGRELYYPKNGISHYDAAFQKNPYANYLEPIVKRYFDEIDSTDKRMMDHCYVFARGTQQIEEGMQKRLTDEVTSFFKADGAENITDIRTGGKLGERIAKSLKKEGDGEVLILYGGKGAGKSTFLRRLLYYDATTKFSLHGFPIIVECINAPQDNAAITNFIWDQIILALDQEQILSGTMDGLLSLFADRFEIAKRQELSGYGPGSGGFYKARNELVVMWKKDKVYVAKRLNKYWLEKGRKVVVAFDNTDQLPPALQDHCFLLAHSITHELECIGIISMREERYCRARTVGVLDAYHNSGYHLAAPALDGVFEKRILLVIYDLGDERRDEINKILPSDAPAGDLKRFFLSCLRQLRNEDNPLRSFVEQCSRDNTRLALGFFGQFVSSGYTHVEEMIREASWTVTSHQVIKPMMIPQRFNYDENKSLVPNLYQCRTPHRGSHFTTIRLLSMLRHGNAAPKNPEGYLRVDALVDEFDKKFGMRLDCEAALDLLLGHRLVEANNRLDKYFVEKAGSDSKELIYADEIRITAFGIYMLEHLCAAFTYLELASLDCGLAEETLYHEFCAAAMNERSFGPLERRDRMASRLNRAAKFVEYLKSEETREKAEFILPDSEDIMAQISISFENDRQKAITSARRNIPRPAAQDDNSEQVAPGSPTA